MQLHHELEKKMNLRSSATRNDLLKIAVGKGEILKFKEGKYRYFKLAPLEGASDDVNKLDEDIIYEPKGL